MKICRIGCSNCDFGTTSPDAVRFYAISDSGERVWCRHPGDRHMAAKVLGCANFFDIPKRTRRKRTGFNCLCLCLDCHSQCFLDIHSWDWHFGFPRRRDQRRCPECGSRKVMSLGKLVDRQCPMCGKGTIRVSDTGAKT